MPNTSATGGVLLPLGAPPADDDALDALLQAAIASITGLDGTLVRPRWQPSVPKQPEAAVNWCAIGVMFSQPDNDAWIALDPANPLQSLYYRHEAFECLASFYGPQSKQYAATLRDGLEIDQNRETLAANAIAYVGVGVLRSIPELVNQQWIKRTDLTIDFRRKVTRTYAIESLLAAGIDLTDDTSVNDVIAVPPGTVLQP